MAYNFQDVIRDVHDPSTHSLKTTGSAAATVFAVVNTGAAGQASVVLDTGLNSIGFATVAVSTPTLYAVVNTGAVGVGNSIVTIANTPLSTQIVGNVTLSDPKGFIGLVTIVGSLSAPAGNVTLDPGSRTGLIGTVTIQDGGNSLTVDGNVGILGNVTLSDSKNYIGLVTATSNQGTNPWISSLVGNITLSDPKGFIGLVTVVGSLSAAAGNVTLDAGSKTQIVGNVTISDSKTFIGLTTSVPSMAWPDPKGYIGLVTITGSLSAPSGNVTLDAGSLTGIIGNLTISDSKGFIGLTTTVIGSAPTIFAVVNTAAAGQASVAIDGPVAIKGNITISDSKEFIGLVSVSGFTNPLPVTQSGTWDEVGINDSGNSITIDGNVGILGNATLSDAKTYIGLTTSTLGIGTQFIGLVTVAPHALVGNLTLSDAKTYIGLNTVTNGIGDRFMGLVTAWVSGVAGNVTLSDAKTYVGLTTTTLGIGTQFIGLVTVAPHALTGLVTLADAKTYIGLVTAWGLNAGSAKTLTPFALTLSTGSVATIAVPTNNARMYITNMVLSSDATVRVSIKSGVTYMTGNASIGIVLNPGGGFIQTGAPDSPSWIGLPSGALVVEKFDMTGTKANIGGTVVTYTE